MSLTQRFLRATPMRVDTTANLAQIKAAIDAANPKVDNLKPGWGSIEDGDEIIGSVNFTPTTHDAISWDGTDEIPESLGARLYYYKRDATLRRLAPTGASPGAYHVLKAVDVVIVPVPDLPGTYTVLAATWDVDEFDLVLDQMKGIVASLDDRATWTADSSVLDLETDDFFLWLLYRGLQATQITSDIKLNKLRNLDAKDRLSHTINLGEGIDSSRGETLYLAGAPGVKFGPSRMLLTHSRLQLNVDLELKIKGAFSITMKYTTVHYEEGETVDDVILRLRAFQQVANVVVPELRAAYQGDAHWIDGYRDEFRAMCRAETHRLTA